MEKRFAFCVLRAKSIHKMPESNECDDVGVYSYDDGDDYEFSCEEGKSENTRHSDKLL